MTEELERLLEKARCDLGALENGGDLIRAVQNHYNWSLRQMGKEIHVSYAVLSRICTNDRQMTPKTLKKIIDAIKDRPEPDRY